MSWSSESEWQARRAFKLGITCTDVSVMGLFQFVHVIVSLALSAKVIADIV